MTEKLKDKNKKEKERIFPFFVDSIFFQGLLQLFQTGTGTGEKKNQRKMGRTKNSPFSRS